MRLLGVTASPRPAGNTDTVLQAALEGARSVGFTTEFAPLRDMEYRACSGHSNCRKLETCVYQDDLQLTMEEFLSYESVILASPVYYWNVTASLKAFIDRHYFYYTHKRNMSALSCGIIIVAHSSGFEEVEHFLKRFLVSGAKYAAGYEGIEVLTVTASSDSPAEEKPELLQQARDFGRKLAEASKQRYERR